MLALMIDLVYIGLAFELFVRQNKQFCGLREIVKTIFHYLNIINILILEKNIFTGMNSKLFVEVWTL